MMLLFSCLLLLLCAAVVARPDYYEVLNVSADAEVLDIKKAYRRLSLLYHPEKAPLDEVKFMEIVRAYEVLSKDELRAVYDELWHDGLRDYYINNEFQDREFYSFLVDPSRYERFPLHKVVTVLGIVTVLAVALIWRKQSKKKRHPVKVY